MDQAVKVAGRPGELVVLGMAPHPPIMVPEVGRGEDRKVKASQEALLRLGSDIASADPDLLVVITPHGPVFQDVLVLAGTPELKGNLGQFRASSVSFSLENDLELVDLLSVEAEAAGIPTLAMSEGRARRFSVGTELDHGVMVPLYFVRQAYKNAGRDPGFKLVVITYGWLSLEDLYRFGMVLNRTIVKSGRRAALIASGDLSHRLTPDAPSGFRPEGAVYDQEMNRITAEGDVLGVFRLSPGLVDKAGDCALRSFVIAWGAADGFEIAPQVYSYEGPFGVGYMIANLGIGAKDPSRQMLEAIRGQRETKMSETRGKESAPVRLARDTIEHYIGSGERSLLPPDVPPELKEPAGVFVSLKKHGQLRGCIGTIAPTRPSAAEEIMQNAISAALRDPRFPEVEASELEELEYSVDILGKPEPIESMAQLDPHRYGVIVSKGSKRGLLLPDLEGIDTAEEQVAIARQKAGIAPGEPVKLERFEVVRYK
ncbi:MAG: AmmeMemoRadiSam system protein A [Firmicutes bacterium]|nr:AmmeMemoRadiSam system protein A [Bacillota bacterium]